MKKRIYINITGMLLLCILLLSTSFGYIFYSMSKNQEVNAIQDRAHLVADLLNQGINEDYINSQYYAHSSLNSPFADFISNDFDIARMTIVSPDGTVLLDNKTIAADMENHLDREEILSALEGGTGEATRTSDTFGESTYYYALALNDGNVLRISKTVSSIVGIFTAALPVVAVVTLIVFILAHFMARRLTGHILKPLYDIDFEGENIAVYDELLPYVRKIDQQKLEIEEHLSTLQERADTIQAITHNMKEGLLLLDHEGAILSSNSSAEEIFDRDILVGMNILEVCRNLDLQKTVKTALAGTGAEMLLEREDKIYQVYINPVYSADKIDGVVAFFMDTTESYKAERQRREFSANVSHELKTPLTTISGYSEMISNGMAKPEDVPMFAGKITEQTARLISMIDGIIRLSQFDENKFDKAYSTFNLKNIAASVTSSLEEKAAEKKVTIHVQQDDLIVNGNFQMIDELLYNLTENAIKYNKEDGEIRISFSREEEYCKIIVADTGIGISKEHCDRIFERFYRVDKSRNKKTGGTGLGLSISKHITEYHHGWMEAESIEGVGTSMICHLKI